jgi:hypothetical protein
MYKPDLKYIDLDSNLQMEKKIEVAEKDRRAIHLIHFDPAKNRLYFLCEVN